MKCRICRAGDVQKLFAKDFFGESWDIYECGKCGVQFVDFSRRDEASLQGDYEKFFGTQDREAGMHNADAGRRAWRRQAAIIDRLLGGGAAVPRRILDIGCHAGHFLDNMPAHYEKHGIELYGPAAEVARGKNIRVHTGKLEETRFPDAHFDAVTMFAFIEHVLDPAAVLRECRRILKPGGVLAVMTGDAASGKARRLGPAWHMYCPPIHQFYFRAAALDRLLMEIGFRKAHWFYTDGGMTNFRNRYLNFVAKRLLIFMQRIPWLNRLPFFDHYYAYYLKERN